MLVADADAFAGVAQGAFGKTKPAQRIAADIAQLRHAVLQELVWLGFERLAFVADGDEAGRLLGRTRGFHTVVVFLFWQKFINNFAARREVGIALVNVGHERVTAQGFILLCKARHRQRRAFACGAMRRTLSVSFQD